MATASYQVVKHNPLATTSCLGLTLAASLAARASYQVAVGIIDLGPFYFYSK